MDRLRAILLVALAASCSRTQPDRAPAVAVDGAAPDDVKGAIAPPSASVEAPALDDLEIRTLAMTDARLGWALDATGRVLRTLDGGDRFAPTTQPGPPGGPGDRRFAAVDGSIAWLVDRDSAMLYRTIDAGASWSAAQPFPQGYEVAIAPLDDLHAWSTVVETLKKVGSTAGCFVTEDGGARWSRKGALVMSSLVVVPRSTKEAWIRGADETRDFVTVLRRTVDGGRTWQTPALSPPSDIGEKNVEVKPHSAPAFWGPTRANGAFVGLVQRRDTGAQRAIALYLTTDGGASWRSGPTYRLPGSGIASAAAASEHGAIAFVGQPDGRAPNYDNDTSCLVVRAGAGGTWSELGTVLCPNADTDRAQLVTPNDVFVKRTPNPYAVGGNVGPTQLHVSRDGGRTWKRAQARSTRR